MASCTFAALRDNLIGLGFQMNAGAGTPILFEHPQAAARLILDPFADQDVVDPATLAVVRRNLDERGILPRARFEEMLRQRSIAG